MRRTLDELDRKLIRLLQGDARMSTSEIGRRLDVARSTVHERIERLKREGVIDGFTVLLNRDPLETLNRAIVFVEIDPKLQNRIVVRLEEFPEISSCFTVNGAFDLSLIVEMPQLEDLDALLDEIGEIEGVVRTMTNIVLAKKFDRRHTLINETAKKLFGSAPL
ncbi:MAG: Lrp/AsnC family transcriptional regulator [Cohaesibacter sp.]|nr:Lrp/AsnC family transcriptional regulator [Cohaesibacter sp.]